MKQLELFPVDPQKDTSDASKATVFSLWKLFVDGASRNNPGPAGAGVYITKDDVLVHTRGVYLGKKTNNEAEYLAMLLGLFELKSMVQKGDLILIVSDSQLLIQQLRGVYRVKEPRLQKLHALAKLLLVGINYDALHVLREQNTHADALANQGVDTKTAAPANFITFLQQHALSL